VQISTGAYAEKTNLSRLININIAWVGQNWADEMYVTKPSGNLG
jgi:hypothetical protein